MDWMIDVTIKRRAGVVAVLIGVLALGLRVPAIGDFMTVDEQNWMLRSGEFMKSIRRGHFAGTFQGTHPGATGMWLMGSGIALQEERVGTEISSDNLVLFHKAAVLPVVIAVSSLVAVCAGLLALLFGWEVGLLAGIYIAVEPYLVGMSQIAHLDALQAFSMLATLLLWLCFVVFQRRLWSYATGVLLGTSFGLKLLLALWLVPSIAGVTILLLWQRNELGTWKKYVRSLVVVILLSLVTFILLWPAVLTKKDLQLGYLGRDTVTIVTDEHGTYENTEGAIDSRTFYIRSVLGRLTPLTQVLVVASMMYGVWSRWQRRRGDVSGMIPTTDYMILIGLILYAAGYLILITLAAKKADRYMLPALAIAPLLAGWVVAQARSRLVLCYPGRRVLVNSLVGLVLLVSLVPAFMWSPHTIAYSNPLFPDIRPITQQGWGEGLELAAAWLNTQPNVQELYIASWYPSVMHPFFKGKTMSLSSRADYRVQYIVTYRNMGGRAGDDQASDVIDELKGLEPVQTLYIRNVPYAWVYETDNIGNFIAHAGEIAGARVVGQTVRPPVGEWRAIDIGLATFGSRVNTEDIILEIRSAPETKDALRTVRLNSRQALDNKWNRFSFEPITVAPDEEFYVHISSPSSVAGNAITVRYSETDARPGELFINGVAKDGDMAYRIPE